MVILEISFFGHQERAPFRTEAEAQLELDRLRLALDADPYRSNAEKTHIIKCEPGDIVVVLSKIDTARIIDHDKFQEIVADTRAKEEQDAIDYAVRKARALSEVNHSTRSVGESAVR